MIELGQLIVVSLGLFYSGVLGGVAPQTEPRGYSRDLRERLLQAVASGQSVVEIASLTDVSESSLRR